MNQHLFIQSWTRHLLLLAVCAPFLAVLPGCGPSSTPEAPEQPPVEEDAVPAPVADADAPFEESGTGDSSKMEEDSGADAQISIEPPSEGPVQALPAVSEVNTAQLKEIVDATAGKVTVLNIWATWCVPCVHEMPDLVTFYNETDREDVAFVSLSIDDVPEISGAIPEFQREHKVPFPIYVMNERDDEGMVKALRGEFEGIIPATYLYDREGTLVETIQGAVTLAELHEKVKPLLDSGDAS